MIVFRSAVLVIKGPIAIPQMFHSSYGTFRCERQCSPLAILPPISTSPFRLLLIHFLVRPLFHQRSPDSSSVHSSNKSITRKQAAVLFRREKFILLQVCLMGRHLVFPFLRGKSLELAALGTIVDYHEFVWPFDHVNDS